MICTLLEVYTHKTIPGLELGLMRDVVYISCLSMNELGPLDKDSTTNIKSRMMVFFDFT